MRAISHTLLFFRSYGRAPKTINIEANFVPFNPDILPTDDDWTLLGRPFSTHIGLIALVLCLVYLCQMCHGQGVVSDKVFVCQCSLIPLAV